MPKYIKLADRNPKQILTDEQTQRIRSEHGWYPGMPTYIGQVTISKTIAERRRDREAAAGPGWTVDEWRALLARYGHRCLACGIADSNFRDTRNCLVADHVIPLHRGGLHHISNVQPLCIRCNFAKAQRLTDFRPDRATIPGETPGA